MTKQRTRITRDRYSNTKALCLAATASATALLALVASGCNPKVTMEGGDKPIHIVMDVNVRVQNDLEDFYSFRKQTDATVPTTLPTTAPTGR